MKSNVARLTGAGLLALFAVSAHAQGWQWLQDSPVRFFNDRDWELMRGTTRELLDDGSDGASKTWENPDTGSKGEITVLRSGEHQGMRCRDARFRNEARGLTSGGIYRMCKMPDGSWKFAP